MSQPRVVSSKMSPPLAVGEPSPPIPPVRDPAATVSEMDDRWSRMLPELLGEIIRRVEASEEQWPLRKDVVSCACVCRRWRYVTAGVVRPPVETGKITFPSSLKQPGPRESPIQCFIQRNKKNSTFYLYLSLTETFLDKGKFLLAARRFRHGAHTQYILSLDADDLSQGSNAYVGKLRSDFLGTNFIAYDSRPPFNGAKASSSRASRRFASKQISPQVPAGNFEIGRISYKFNLLKSRGPRRMQCVLQCPSASETPEEDSLKPKVQNSAGALILRNKAPRWHEHLQCWCLNFHGRVTVASVKNFQLVATADPSQPEGKGDSETVLLQFGKVGDDMFTMDYRQPLSAFQAFAICLTSFGTKYGCADVPDVFRSKFQTAPLDLGTDDFYVSRKNLIESQLQKIQEGSGEEILITSWETHMGTACKGVTWDRYSLTDLRAVVSCIGGPCLASLCRHLAQDYRSWSSGMPDLLLWRFHGGDGNEGKAKLVEVKGPSDRLSEQQRAWLLVLMDCGFDAEVCKVSANESNKNGKRKLECEG